MTQWRDPMNQFLPFLRSLRHRLSHTHQSLHILARRTSLSEAELSQISNFKSEISLHLITSPTDPLFPSLVQIQAEQGLDEAWCREQIDSDATALLATIDQAGQP